MEEKNSHAAFDGHGLIPIFSIYQSMKRNEKVARQFYNHRLLRSTWDQVANLAKGGLWLVTSSVLQ